MAGPLDDVISLLSANQTPASGGNNEEAAAYLNDPKNRSAIMADASRIAAMQSQPGASAPTRSAPIQSAPMQSAAEQRPGPLDGVLDILAAAPTTAPTAKTTTPGKPAIQSPVFRANVGLAETGLHAATSLLGQVAGGWAGILSGGNADTARKVSDALTYEPRTEAGQAVLHGIGQIGNTVANAPGIKQVINAYDTVADKAGSISPVAGAAIRTLPAAVGTLAAPEVRGALGSAMRPLRGIGQAADIPVRIEPSIEKPRLKLNVDGTTTPVPPQPQPQPVGGASVATRASGAAATATPALPANLQNASIETQQHVAQLVRKGQPIDQDVLARHVDAESLPVPVKLTEGQATLSPDLISTEMNGRGKLRPTVDPDFYNQQGKALAGNLDAIRANVAPETSAMHPTEAGQTLIDRYKMMDEPVVQDINAKYQALRDANGGQFPVDAGQLLTNVRTALRKELLSNDAPASQMHELERLATDGNMTFEDFLSLRRNLGNVSRTAVDGNTRTAAGIMARQLEDLPLSPEAAALKPLADDARAAARARFQRLDADPAYKAAINDGVSVGEPSPLADKFVQSYVTGDNARAANLKQMRANLGSDPVASQTIAASTLDHLAQAAKADTATGKFMADAYSKRVNALGQKLDDLVGPDAAAQLEQVKRVANYTSAQPRGSYVNNSNTLVGTMSEIGKQGLSMAAAVKTMGASKVAEEGYKAYKAASAAKRATAPAAGIAIKDFPK